MIGIFDMGGKIFHERLEVSVNKGRDPFGRRAIAGNFGASWASFLVYFWEEVKGWGSGLGGS